MNLPQKLFGVFTTATLIAGVCAIFTSPEQVITVNNTTKLQVYNSYTDTISVPKNKPKRIFYSSDWPQRKIETPCPINGEECHHLCHYSYYITRDLVSLYPDTIEIPNP
jgi:hypothetical protein